MKKYTEPKFMQIDFMENILNSSGEQVNPNADDFGVNDDLGDIGALTRALNI